MTIRKDFPPRPAPLAEEVRAMLAAAPTSLPISRGTPQRARAEQDRVVALRAPGPHVAVVRDLVIDGPGGVLPLRLYRPERPVAVLAYFHGGGWVMGSIADSDAHVRRMVAVTGCAVLSVGYRLAPEHPFPAAIEDALAAWRWVCGNLADLGPLAIAGDSAGGNIAAGATIALRDLGSTLPAFQILGYPVTSAAMDTASYRDQADGPVLSATDMRWFWDHYAPHPVARTDPRASPLDAVDLSGLPPALILTAECDPLRDEGEVYVARMVAAGVDARFHRYPGMVHGFYKMADLLSGGRDALADAAAFVRQQIAAMPDGHVEDAK